MLDFKRLAVVAWDGLDDMLPALKKAISEQRNAPLLKRAYGPQPQWLLVGLGLACLLLGELFSRFGPDLPFKEYVSWPAVLLGLAISIIWRRFLFGTDHSDLKVGQEQYTLLAASTIPALVIVLLGIAFLGDAGGTLTHGHEPETLAGQVMLTITGIVAVAAALTIAIASLSYSRDWAKALMDLAIRLLIFRITIWVTTLIIIEIGWLGSLVGFLLGGIFGIELPEWLPGLVDELTYALFLLVAFLAIIGGTWTVCRDSFSELISKGDVNILSRLEVALEGDQKKAKKSKKAKKAANKAANKAKKAGNKQETLTDQSKAEDGEGDDK